MEQFIGKGTVSLFGLLGSIVLLLWGVRMIRKVFEQWLLSYINVSSKIFNHKIYGLLFGMFGAALLQSSTALVLIVSSIATQIAIPLSIGLAFVLGADVGTSIAALLFSFDIKSLGPLLLFLGFFIQRTAKKDINRNRFGQVLMGFGFVLYGLSSIGEISVLMRESELVSTLFTSAFINDIALAMLLVILLTWLSHSSLAIVLLIIELVASHAVSLELGLSLVLGANIGACLPAYTDSIGLAIEARRLTFGNVIFRIFGGLLALPFMGLIFKFFEQSQTPAGDAIISFHIFFNSAVAMLFIFFTKPIGRVIEKILPEPEKYVHNGIKTKFLHSKDIENPVQAIINLKKEVLRISDNLYVMIGYAAHAVEVEKEIKEILKIENDINALYKSVSKYLQKLYAQTLSDVQVYNCQIINSYCTDLELAADIISSNVLESIAIKHKKKLNISKEYQEQLDNIFIMLKENLNISQELFRVPTRDMALDLVARKEHYKKNMIQQSLAHKQDILVGNAESIEINTIYLDMVNDLRRVNAHVASIALHILDEKEV